MLQADTFSCEALKDGRCSGYAQRPMVCRLSGATEDLPCPTAEYPRAARWPPRMAWPCWRKSIRRAAHPSRRTGRMRSSWRRSGAFLPADHGGQSRPSPARDAATGCRGDPTGIQEAARGGERESRLGGLVAVPAVPARCPSHRIRHLAVRQVPGVAVGSPHRGRAGPDGTRVEGDGAILDPAAATGRGLYCFACRNTRGPIRPPCDGSWLCSDEAACLSRAGRRPQ